MEVGVGHAKAHGRAARLGVVGHIDEVAAGRELGAARQAVAVYLGDHGLCELPDAHPPLRRQLLPFVASIQVVAG